MDNTGSILSIVGVLALLAFLLGCAVGVDLEQWRQTKRDKGEADKLREEMRRYDELGTVLVREAEEKRRTACTRGPDICCCTICCSKESAA